MIKCGIITCAAVVTLSANAFAQRTNDGAGVGLLVGAMVGYYWR